MSVIVRAEPPPPPTTTPAVAQAAPTAAEPWAIIGHEESPNNQEYWRQFRDGTNSLHPSCGPTTPTPPEWVEERTITYLGDLRDRARARNAARRDRGRGRGMSRQEGRRNMDRVDQIRKAGLATHIRRPRWEARCRMGG